ncbi:MAG: hypothetical protein GY842_07245 [bacterium]|nr:hypothetical protein [bacterium]
MTRALAVALLQLAWLGTAGCVADRTTPKWSPAPTQPIVGIWYGVESIPAPQHQRIAARMDEDLSAIRRMGLNVVFLRHVAPEHIHLLTSTAQRHQLKIVLPDRQARFAGMTGLGSDPIAVPDWLASPEAGMTETLLAADVGWVRPGRSAERAERLAHAYRAARCPTPLFAQTTGPAPPSLTFLASATDPDSPQSPLPRDRSPGRPMMTLNCHHQSGEPDADAIRRWVRGFHTGLAAGLTGGLVIDQFRAVPGGEPALADADGTVDLERINAVRRLTERMRRWGPILDRLNMRSLAAPPGSSDVLCLTLFERDQRRLLLVSNRSPSDYLRTTLALDRRLGGAAANRLVEVPPEERQSVGRITEARRDRIALRLDLAPGDAQLYEVF